MTNPPGVSTTQPARSRFQVHIATRWMCAVMAFGAGMTYAGFANLFDPDSGDFVGMAVLLVPLGVLILIGAEVANLIWVWRQDRLILAEAYRAASAPAGTTVPARVVRARWQPASRISAITGLTGAQIPAMLSVVWTVLPADGPARRAVSIMPWNGPLKQVFGAKTVHGVQTTPDPDIVLFDPTTTAQWRADAQQDPRWRTDRLPTNNSLVGGYWLVIVIALVALAAGWAVATGLCLL